MDLVLEHLLHIPAPVTPWTTEFSGSVNTEPKNMDGVLPRQSGDCGKEQFPELPRTRHLLLPEAVPALTVRKSNVRFLALTERLISTPPQIQAFQYIWQVYNSAT